MGEAASGSSWFLVKPLRGYIRHHSSFIRNQLRLQDGVALKITERDQEAIQLDDRFCQVTAADPEVKKAMRFAFIKM